MLRTILNAPLDELMSLARERFEVDFDTVRVAGTSLEILQIRNMVDYVEALAEQNPDQPLTLPFWARIWPSSLLLAYYIDRLPVQDAGLLEIGAGVGVSSLFAASKGFRAILSDNNDDALLFARINILRNGLQDRAQVAHVDFTTTNFEQRFKWIIGCEILYRDECFRPLVKFLLRHLSPDPEAEVVLALDYIRKAKKFFQVAEPEFLMQQQTVGCKGGPDGKDRHLCTIHRLKPRKPL